MDQTIITGLNFIIENQKELLKQQRINNMLLLANNPNLSPEMQQEYLSKAMVLMGEQNRSEDSISWISQKML